MTKLGQNYMAEFDADSRKSTSVFGANFGPQATKCRMTIHHEMLNNTAQFQTKSYVSQR